MDVDSFGVSVSAENVNAEASSAEQYLRDAISEEKEFNDGYYKKINDVLTSAFSRPSRMTEDERTCISRRLDEEEEAFKTSPLTLEAMQRLKLKIYAAAESHKTRVEKSENYQKGKKENPNMEVETMKNNEDVEDTAWYTKQMLETYVFRKLLTEFPGKFEKEEGVFAKEMFLDRTKIYKYKKNKKKIINQKYEGDCGPITADKIGFMYEDFEGQVLKNKLKKYFPMVEYDEGEKGVDGMYKKNIFPRPGFLDMDEVLTFLKEDGSTQISKNIATEIEDLQKNMVARAYADMTYEVLDVVLQRLTPICKEYNEQFSNIRYLSSESDYISF
jgi:hypothetical protein